MKTCIVIGCGEKLANMTHDLCRKHWQMNQEGRLHKGPNGGLVEQRQGVTPVSNAQQKPQPKAETKAGIKTETKPADDDSYEWYSSSKIGEHFGISASRANLILAELGWIEKYVKGWIPTPQGRKLGAEQREARQNGIPYVIWPGNIIHNSILVTSIKDSTGSMADTPRPTTENSNQTVNDNTSTSETGNDFRERFPAKFRSTDGHLVRSRAEMLIDNWLYMQSIVHAVERKLPIEEEVYCDFYIPQKKVYIEYWGLENDAKYAARMSAKKAIYQRYNLNLVELNDDDIMNLDDVLPRRLLKFGVDCT